MAKKTIIRNDRRRLFILRGCGDERPAAERARRARGVAFASGGGAEGAEDGRACGVHRESGHSSLSQRTGRDHDILSLARFLTAHTKRLVVIFI